MTDKEQLAFWVEGDARCPMDNGDCCPDFSCCNPELMWPREKRLAFQAAHLRGDDKTTMSMLMGALGVLVASESGSGGELEDVTVRVAGTAPREDA